MTSVREIANAALARGNNNYGYVEIDADVLRTLLEVTDDQVLAALNAYDPRFATDDLGDYAEEHVADMRNALEAARDAS